MACITRVSENVCINAEVKITPKVTPGDTITTCRGEAFIGSCDMPLREYCTFNVSQVICVEVPLTFEAIAYATPNGIACSTPIVGGCSSSTECTRSQGYFSTHEEETEALITAAGGSISLGNGGGLTYVVTTANWTSVFDGTIPSPPLPEDPPLRGQYQQ